MFLLHRSQYSLRGQTKGQQTYITDKLNVVINDLGPTKVFAQVTDSVVSMKAAWSKEEH